VAAAVHDGNDVVNGVGWFAAEGAGGFAGQYALAVVPVGGVVGGVLSWHAHALALLGCASAACGLADVRVGLVVMTGSSLRSLFKVNLTAHVSGHRCVMPTPGVASVPVPFALTCLPQHFAQTISRCMTQDVLIYPRYRVSSTQGATPGRSCGEFSFCTDQV